MGEFKESQVVNKNEYNPKLGDPNRYENARGLNKELAEGINKEALNIVKMAMPVLEKIEKNPAMRNFHDPIAGSRWMGDFLQDKHEEILKLYGVTGASSLEEPHATGVPKEIIDFLRRIYQSSK